MVKYEYYSFAEVIFFTIFVVAASLLISFLALYVFNLINFYGHLARLISRRYTDAVLWRKLEKYLEKFKKIHSALVEIEQFKPIIEEINSFL